MVGVWVSWIQPVIPKAQGPTAGETNSHEPKIPRVAMFGAQLRSQPILRWAIAQLRILSWVAYLKMGLAHLKMGYNILAQLRIKKFKKVF